MKAIVVVKKTRLETADERAISLLKRADFAVSGWQAVHEAHRKTVDVVHEGLDRLGVRQDVVRDPYRPFQTQGADVVIVVGGDGTFLAASHSVDSGLPMLGINSDPSSSRGFFCGADAESFQREMAAIVEGRGLQSVLRRMMVVVNDEVRSMRVLNEALVCHPHPAATSRLSFEFDHARSWDKHVSSGAWIGPPAGTTGAIRSAGGDVLPLEASLLEFVAREAIQGENRKVVTAGPIRAVVKNDVAHVYMDGPYKYAVLALGDRVEFRVSEQSLTVLGLGSRR